MQRAIIILWWLGSVAAFAQPVKTSQLEYKASFGIIPAGSVRLEVKTDTAGKELHLHAGSDFLGVNISLYSWLSRTNQLQGANYVWSNKTEEKIRLTECKFYYFRNDALKDSTLATQPIFELLSVLDQVCCLNWRPEQADTILHFLRVVLLDTNLKLGFRLEKRRLQIIRDCVEDIEVPGYQGSALKIILLVKGEHWLLVNDKVTLWLSDDDHHLLLKIEARVRTKLGIKANACLELITKIQ